MPLFRSFRLPPTLRRSGLVLFLAGAAVAASPASVPIRFAGHDMELTISEVSARTVRLQLLAFDPQGRPHPTPASDTLVPFPQIEKLRAREIEGTKELSVGELRVAVVLKPLTVTVRRGDGTLVQTVSFVEEPFSEAAVTFQTGAPVLGLGEGGQQFDRRGALLAMEATGTTSKPRRGSIVPSPFVIGTEGWALLVHQPDGRFDLREATARFLPRITGPAVSVDLFVIDCLITSPRMAEIVPTYGTDYRKPENATQFNKLALQARKALQLV